jgi:pilus assembly protein FimV
MQKQRHQRVHQWLRPVAALAVLLCATPAVNAAGFAGHSSGATLGKALDFSVQVRLDPGAEPLTPECVSAEVTTGDLRLQPNQVRTVIESQSADLARLRVQTTQSIDEPVIGVNLSVGCSARLSRRFVILADPPGLGPQQPAQGSGLAVAAPAEPLLAAAVPAASSAIQATAATQAAQPAMGAIASPRKTARVTVPRPRATARPVVQPAARVAAAAPAPAPAAPAAAAAAASGVRLKLDFEDTRTARAGVASPATPAVASNDNVDQALAAVAKAALAAQAAASAASAAQDRIALLERTVEQLRSEAKSSRDQATQLRDKLIQAEGAGDYTVPLLAVAAALAGLAAWLAWRLGRVQGQRHQAWAQAGTAAAPGSAGTSTGNSRFNSSSYAATVAPSRSATQPTPFGGTDSPTIPPLSATSRSGRSSVPAWPPAAPADPWAEVNSGLEHSGDAAPEALANPVARTEPLPRDVVTGAARDVSIEELIDLEQQAEFFIVLGQDEAAIDLLVDHLRSTGGSSPLPYLKLLEIYHRRGEHAAYERMRARFNHRFNAYAPEWGVDLTHGRALDAYPSVIPRLEQVWPRPLDAMAELEALLFRKSRGELFELPAYREVLFLYSLARDLLDREAVDTGSVDLLLPLADGGEFSSTAPAPFLDADTFAAEPRRDYDDRPTAPVDFDLTQPPPQVSIFDTVEDGPRGRR